MARTLDLARQVGLVLVGVMHHLRDDDPRSVYADGGVARKLW